MLQDGFTSPAAAGHDPAFKRGGVIEKIAVNRFDDSFYEYSSIAGREIFLRNNKYLYCISKSSVDDDPK